MQKQDSKPLLIAIGGLSGSGKTSLGAALLDVVPNAVHLDSDRIRKEIFGVAETVPLPQEAFSSEATYRVIKETTRRIKENIAAGRSVIASNIFVSHKSRISEEKLAQAVGADFIGLWLQADLSVLFDRVAKRVDNVSNAGEAVVKMQAAKDPGDIAWAVIDANQPREAVIGAAVKIIKAEKGQALVAKGPKPR